MTYKVLSIAGFDGSGGAGIQADLKTFSAFGCYGMTVLTALPIQNTCGVKKCYDIPLQAIEDQLHAIFDDIIPDSIKIGMMHHSKNIELVASFLKQKASTIPIVLDPVTVAKSGHPLLISEAIEALTALLMPLATIITPNIPEAHTFTDIRINTQEHMLIAAQKLLDYGSKYILVKGGHLDSPQSDDLLLGVDGTQQWFTSSRIDSQNIHGTGCTLSAAIASCLAQNLNIVQACNLAKKYLSHALLAGKDQQIGKGNGPVHHFYHLWPTLPLLDSKS